MLIDVASASRPEVSTGEIESLPEHTYRFGVASEGFRMEFGVKTASRLVRTGSATLLPDSRWDSRCCFEGPLGDGYEASLTVRQATSESASELRIEVSHRRHEGFRLTAKVSFEEFASSAVEERLLRLSMSRRQQVPCHVLASDVEYELTGSSEPARGAAARSCSALSVRDELSASPGTWTLAKVWFAGHVAAYVIQGDAPEVAKAGTESDATRVTTLQTHLPHYGAARLWRMTLDDLVRWVGVCASPGVVDAEYVEAYRGLTQVELPVAAGRRRRDAEVKLSVWRFAFPGVLRGASISGF